MADHERLILLMFEELIDRLTPETLILVGHSSGADQLLRILAGEESRSIRPDALVALGPATRPSPMAISTRYLELTGEPQNTLRVIQAISSGAEDLDQWLADHEYLARAFRKFRYDVGPLRRFASDLVASRPPGAFFEYFRAVSARVPQIRCVFAIEEADDRDHALRRHLEEDALGENFSEEMFVDARAHHIDMRNASVLAPLLEELVKAIESGAD